MKQLFLALANTALLFFNADLFAPPKKEPPKEKEQENQLALPQQIIISPLLSQPQQPSHPDPTMNLLLQGLGAQIVLNSQHQISLAQQHQNLREDITALQGVFEASRQGTERRLQSEREIIEQKLLHFSQQTDTFDNRLYEEARSRETGDYETRQLVGKLEDKITKLENHIQSLEQDIQKYTGKKFLNLFATIISLIKDQLSEIEIKQAMHTLLFWDRKVINNRILAYLFLITTIIPTFVTNHFQNSIVYKWFALYTIFLLPFWIPVKLLTQFNILNRSFWGGFEQFEKIITAITASSTVKFLCNNKKIVALALLCALIIIVTTHDRKRYKFSKHSKLLKKAYEKLCLLLKIKPSTKKDEMLNDNDDEEIYNDDNDTELYREEIG